ncbi:hypothetical protein AB4095_01355 [Bilophila wadsworthia]|uniref:hypothetical protein n=1 Tax=Bilophila wadsworthia TaxID=35833 RepID=UPI0034CF4190
MDMLKVFEKAEFGRVRVVECEGELWLAAKDVCECLELTEQNHFPVKIPRQSQGLETR